MFLGLSDIILLREGKHQRRQDRELGHAVDPVTLILLRVQILQFGTEGYLITQLILTIIDEDIGIDLLRLPIRSSGFSLSIFLSRPRTGETLIRKPVP